MEKEKIFSEVKMCLDVNEKINEETIIFYATVISRKKDGTIKHTFIQMENEEIKEKIAKPIGQPEELFNALRRAQQFFYEAIKNILIDRGVVKKSG